MKHAYLMCLIILFSTTPLFADVIRLHNGEVLFGSISSVEQGSVTVSTLGGKRSLSNDNILKSEPSLNGIKSLRLDVYLKGGSVLNGSILDYDEDIGLLINIDFGKITVPVESIDHIEDSSQARHYKGNPFTTGINGGYYQPIGIFADNYGSDFYFNGFCEFQTGLYRGLFGGAELSYYHTSFTSNSDIQSSIYSLQPYAMYRFFQFNELLTWFHNITPFVATGIGPALVIRYDERPLAKTPVQREYYFSFSTKAGADYQIIDNFGLRITTSILFIPQSGGVITIPGISLGAFYSL